MTSRLPQLNALRALDGMARHGSMTKAAVELHLTPSAISHAIKLLEDDLGFSLTERSGRGVELTRAGRVYALEVRKALSILSDAHGVATESGLKGHFALSCAPGLAMFWLIHHLGEFRDQFPNVEIRIASPEDFSEVADPEIDLFIAFGSGKWRGYDSELLTELEFAPYCSPALLNALGGLSEPQDLKRYPLLHLRSHDDWTRWFSAAGVPNLAAESGIVLSNMYLVLAGALDGLGVAIGDNIACRRALSDGTLVRPFPMTIRSTEGYYFVSEPSKRHLPISVAFREWMRSTLTL